MIAAINIENAYHARMPDAPYTPFSGICLTDTFQMTEWNKREHIASEFFLQNSAKVDEQKAKPITVILGNPPYSAGQKAANDNAQNQEYPKLEEKIGATYAEDSAATNKNSLYDSYIKAFRWATDRLDKNGGVIGFITNGGWLDGSALDGFRKHLAKDFSSIYVFNLRGNCRTSGELRKKEGQEVFPGIRVSPAITLLVKRSDSVDREATIYYHDIGDYLSQKEKFEKIKSFGSVCNPDMKWELLHPNDVGDWINQRNPVFATYYPLGDKKGDESDKAVFVPQYSRGLETDRDAWCYHSAKTKLQENIQRSIAFYNSQVDAFQKAKISRPNLKAEDFVTYDSTKFTWSSTAMTAINRLKKYSFSEESLRYALYRPFFKQFVYFNREMNQSVSYVPSFFPTPDTPNRVICVSGIGVPKEFSTLITDVIPDVQLIANAQCFPLYYYEAVGSKSSVKSLSASQTALFATDGEDTERKQETQYIRKDGVSDFILNEARSKYSDQTVTKEDIFYYVYGFLHSREYRATFSADLKKILARIPLVAKKEDFLAFSRCGRELAELHLHYEDAAPYPGVEVTGTETGNFRVQELPGAEDEIRHERG